MVSFACIYGIQDQICWGASENFKLDIWDVERGGEDIADEK